MDLSFNEAPDLYSLLSKRTVQPNSKRFFKELVKDSYRFVERYLSLLPSIDHDIARLYYIDDLSQDQISDIFDISQAAVSRRLKYVLDRIKFLLKMPGLNPVNVRRDLQDIFPPELFESAYFFYWELAQNRVKFFIKTSQSGAANKFFKILDYLEELASNVDSDKDIMDDECQRKQYLALIYLDYYRFIHKKSNIITFLCKKNDSIRSNALITNGDSVM